MKKIGPNRDGTYAVATLDRRSRKKKFTCLATALARSLHVSVLPVPAGPSGAPPRFSLRAPIRVLE